MFAYSAANRLTTASGAYGSASWTYDGVGNRTGETLTQGGITTTDTLQYPSTSNRVETVVRGASTIRTLSYDGAGNIITDARSGTTYGYTYNVCNRLASVSAAGVTQATYVYDAAEQLAIRDSLVAPAGVTHYVHDIFGNVIAETAGASGTVREYIWLYETEIAPTSGSRTTVDRPLAVVDAVNTASPATWWVSVDHLRVKPEGMPEPPGKDDGCGQTRGLVGGVDAVGISSVDHRLGDAQRPLPGAVVPGRSGVALQLAPPLRSQPGPLHPARPARLRRWAECVWVCGWESCCVL